MISAKDQGAGQKWAGMSRHQTPRAELPVPKERKPESTRSRPSGDRVKCRGKSVLSPARMTSQPKYLTHGNLEMRFKPLVDDQEVHKYCPAEFRFLEACEFYALFKSHHGPAAGLRDNRFLWMCHADAFLMAIVSLKDLIDPRPTFHKNDAFQFLTVMRNITVHQAAVAASSPLLMINKAVAISVGPPQPHAPDHDEPILVADRITSALADYEAKLRAVSKGIDNKTGLPRTLWDLYGKNVIAARKWNAWLASQSPTQIALSAVFLEVIQFIAKETGYAVPPLP